MVLFRINYLYELPEDIQVVIYKKVFEKCINDIRNDKNIKYINRLYRATINPNNTCIYYVKPREMFQEVKHYKYKRIVMLEDFGNNKMNEMIYLDRKHLIENTLQFNCNTISYYLYPLFTTNKTLKKYLTIRLNFIKFYDKKLIKYMKVVEDRIDITFISNFKCNADIYYMLLVGYNVLYNSLSNIIYSEENVVMFHIFIELFRWIECNNILEGYKIDNYKIIPIFEGKISKN
jgi:hypothetical protein